MYNIAIVLIISAIKIAKSNEEMNPKRLDRADNDSRYIARTIMISMFEDTEKYIRGLNEYIQKIETPRFKKKSKIQFDLFTQKYGKFVTEARELERAYLKIKHNAMEDRKMEKFNDSVSRIDGAFTDATKVYTKTFRRLNEYLTKLDGSKIMYTDAEVFKTHSKVSIRSQNHLTAMEKLIELLESRSDECGPISNKDDFYMEAIKVLTENKKTIEKICDEFPDSILKESEFDELEETYQKVKDSFKESITAMEKFDEALKNKYVSNQVKYDKRFKKTIVFIGKLPFRISGFVTPSVVGTIIILFAVMFQL